jgi:DNA-binding transcriptional MerR regulator
MAEKLYRIGDAAALLGLETHVLRYWETEFSQLRPVRTGKGQRRYTEEDVAMLSHIRYLLHDQGLTIEGARRVLAGEFAFSQSGEPSAVPDPDRHVAAAMPPAGAAPFPASVPDAPPDSLAAPALAADSAQQPDAREDDGGHSEAILWIADELRAMLRLLRG